MNRRGFLSLIAPAAALIAAPELLLPRKTFFLPPAGGWRLTAAEIANMALLRLAALDRIVNPPLVGNHIALSDMLCDLHCYGSGVLEIQAGRVYHVPIEKFEMPLPLPRAWFSLDDS